MSSTLKEIKTILQSKATAATAASHHKFVPGITKVYGVIMPELNALLNNYKNERFELVTALWQSGAYEERVLAAKLLGKMAKRDATTSLRLVDEFSIEIDNWAVCDTLGMQSLKPIVKSHQKEIFALANKLNQSSNLWQRRLSLVLVEWYTRDKAYHPAIKTLVKALEDDKEYYVKKAIEWINRNLEKGK